MTAELELGRAVSVMCFSVDPAVALFEVVEAACYFCGSAPWLVPGGEYSPVLPTVEGGQHHVLPIQPPWPTARG
jgi:hypothetical protein